jgi:hypothetical protein
MLFYPYYIKTALPSGSGQSNAIFKSSKNIKLLFFQAPARLLVLAQKPA